MYNEQRMVRASCPRVPLAVILKRFKLLGTIHDPRHPFDENDALVMEILTAEDDRRREIFAFIDRVLNKFHLSGKMAARSEQFWSWIIHEVREGPWEKFIEHRFFDQDHERRDPFIHALDGLVALRAAKRRLMGIHTDPGFCRESSLRL